MSKTRARPSKDDILEARSTHTPPEPKRRLKRKEPGPLSEPLEQIAQEHGLVPASEVKPDLAYLPPPDRQIEASQETPFEVGTHLAGDLSFAERVRPNGPRHRAPGEPGSTFTSVSGGFKLTENGSERAFQFSDDAPPTDDEKAALRAAGLGYDPGRRVWAAQATPEVRERTDELALRMSGKKERIEESRGR